MPTHYKGTPQEIRALNAFIKLTRATNSIESRLSNAGTLGNLTMTQFGVLESLLHLGPMCAGELSTKLLKSTGNMTLVIDNLEKHGWVRRERSVEDRRMITIRLTSEGEALIKDVFPRQAAAITQVMSVLTADELEELGRLCKKLGTQNASIADSPPLRSEA